MWVTSPDELKDIGEDQRIIAEGISKSPELSDVRYRIAWLRDSSLGVQVLAEIGSFGNGDVRVKLRTLLDEQGLGKYVLIVNHAVPDGMGMRESR